MISTLIVGTIPYYQGKILLVRNKNENTWYAPSGKLEPKETLEQGAIRETLEETGLRTAIKRILFIKEYHDLENEKIFLKCVWLSEPSILNDIPGDLIFTKIGQSDKNIAERKWFSKDEIQKVNVEPQECKNLFWDIIEKKPLPERYPMIDPYFGNR